MDWNKETIEKRIKEIVGGGGHEDWIMELEDFIQQLLDQRDKEIIGKLKGLKFKQNYVKDVVFPDEEKLVWMRFNKDGRVVGRAGEGGALAFNKAISEAISTIKENK